MPSTISASVGDNPCFIIFFITSIPIDCIKFIIFPYTCYILVVNGMCCMFLKFITNAVK